MSNKIDNSLALDLGADVKQILHDFVFIKSDKYQKEKFTTPGGLTLYKDITLGQDHHEAVSQSGVVKFIPEKHRNGHQIKIKPGDLVYTHHTLCYDKRKVSVNGEILYMIDYESCYFIDHGDDIEMLHDWNLIEPLDNDDYSGSILLFHNNQKYKSGMGKIAYMNKELEDLGLKKGDIVFYESFADYRIMVNDDLFFRMPNKLIFGYLKEDQFNPVGQWNFISEPLVETEIKSDIILIPVSEKQKLNTKQGIVKYPSEYLINNGIKSGDTIIYSICKDKVEINGEELYRVSNLYVDAKVEV